MSGPPLTRAERNALPHDAFIWRTVNGEHYTLDRIDDDHLLNIELHLMGRSSYKLPAGYMPGHPRWEQTYQAIHDEIERRGLALKEETGARIRFDQEEFDRNDHGDASR